MTEEEFLIDALEEIHRLRFIARHAERRLKERGARLRCNWCGHVKKKMTIFWNERTGELLMLCFKGCQNFPESFQDTEAGLDYEHWHRIDPWQDYKMELPRLRKDWGKISGVEPKQTKLSD